MNRPQRMQVTAERSVCRALAEQGNRGRALARLRAFASISPAHASDILRAIEAARPRRTHVLAPLVGAGEALNAAIEVVPGEPPTYIEEEARDAVRRAVTDALADTGAPPRFQLGVELPLVATLGQRVRRASLYLPTYLAVAATVTETPLPRHVLATGDPREPAGDLAAKLRLLDDARATHRIGQLLCACRDAASGRHPAGVLPFASGAAAAAAYFGTLPWHAGVPCCRVHVFSGHRRQPPDRFTGHDVQLVELPDPLTPAHLDDAAARVRGAVAAAPNRRVEVSVGGPLVLAARLGAELKNSPAAVRLVHREQVWWTRGQALPSASPAPPPPSAPAGHPPHVVLTTRGVAAPQGWETLRLPHPLTPAAMATGLARFTARWGAAPVLHLAVDGPWPLAWAAAEQRRNRGLTVYHHWNSIQGRYAPWFEMP